MPPPPPPFRRTRLGRPAVPRVHAVPRRGRAPSPALVTARPALHHSAAFPALVGHAVLEHKLDRRNILGDEG